MKRGRLLALVLALLLLLSLLPTAASATAPMQIGQWEERWVLPYPHGIKQVIHDGSRYLAVTDFQLHTSADGSRWSAVPLPPLQGNRLERVLFALERYFLLTSNGLFVSEDLKSWQPQDLRGPAGLREIAAGEESIIVSGSFYDSGTLRHGIWLSEDGQLWTQYIPGKADPPALERILYHQDRFVGLADKELYYSFDGIVWSRAKMSQPLTHALRDLAAGDGVLVAVGEAGTALRSIDGGRTWTAEPVTPHAHLRRVVYGGGRFVATGSRTGTINMVWGDRETVRLGALFTSADGKGWRLGSMSDAELPDAPAPFESETYQGWEMIDVLAYGPGGFLGAEEVELQHRTAFFTSSDGQDWLRVANDRPRALTTLAYGDGLYLGLTREGELLASTDALSWEVRTAPFQSGAYPPVISYGEYGFMLAGDGGLYRSTDGFSWSREPAVSGRFRAIAYGDGRYVAVGEDGLTAVFHEGVWQTSQAWYNGPVNAVAYGDGRFVIVGALGNIAHSADGRYWQPARSGTSLPLTGIAYGNDRFVVVGGSEGEAQIHETGPAVILSSPDGRRWTTEQESNNEMLRSVAYGDGIFLIGGMNLLVSEDGDRWEIVGGEWQISLVPGQMPEAFVPPISVVAGPGESVVIWGPRLIVRNMVDTARSSIKAERDQVIADGVDTATIVVQLMDKRGRPLPNRTVQLIQSSGKSQTAVATQSTDASGRARFVVHSDARGRFSYSARVDGAALPVPGASVEFVAP